MVNVTLCFSPAQAILAAKAGATFVSPFVGRLDDVGTDGMQLIADIMTIYRQYPELQDRGARRLGARAPAHRRCRQARRDVATAPANVLKQLFAHPLTDKGLAQFNADWKKTGQSVL